MDTDEVLDVSLVSAAPVRRKDVGNARYMATMFCVGMLCPSCEDVHQVPLVEWDLMLGLN